MRMPEPGQSAAEFWDGLYGSSERIWSGGVNARLAEVVADLPPGRALDLGCGEGGDAMWLAEHGWRVVATDVSPVALARAEGDAAVRGVADRIEFLHTDLSEGVPPGPFDLASAHFLHSPEGLGLDRDALFGPRPNGRAGRAAPDRRSRFGASMVRASRSRVSGHHRGTGSAESRSGRLAARPRLGGPPRGDRTRRSGRDHPRQRDAAQTLLVVSTF